MSGAHFIEADTMRMRALRSARLARKYPESAVFEEMAAWWAAQARRVERDPFLALALCLAEVL